MVRLHVKRGDESQFLLEAACGARLAELAPLVARIYNGRLKVQRLCAGNGPPPRCGFWACGWREGPRVLTVQGAGIPTPNHRPCASLGRVCVS